MTTHGAPGVHTEPLLDALAVEAMTARTNPRRTGDRLLADRAGRIHADMLFSGGGNLLTSGYNGHRIHKVPTEIHGDIDDHASGWLKLIRPEDSHQLR